MVRGAPGGAGCAPYCAHRLKRGRGWHSQCVCVCVTAAAASSVRMKAHAGHAVHGHRKLITTFTDRELPGKVSGLPSVSWGRSPTRLTEDNRVIAGAISFSPPPLFYIHQILPGSVMSCASRGGTGMLGLCLVMIHFLFYYLFIFLLTYLAPRLRRYSM